MRVLHDAEGAGLERAELPVSRVVSSAMRRALLLAMSVACVSVPSIASAQEQPAPAPGAATVDLEKDIKGEQAESTAPPPEAPPPLPYKKSVVLDSSLGAMAFFGEFGKVAPPGPWLHTQLGYELLKWFMLFGEGELAFTDTSGREAQPKTRAFAIFGAGGGARFTLRFTDRVGAYAQASAGFMKADVGRNALGNLGFRDAESLDVYACGRLGVEWYQLDRHFALGLTVGARLAQGFANTRPGASDTPLVGDAAASLRYAF